MASRYEHTKMRTNKISRGFKQKRVYSDKSKSTTIYSTIPQTDNDIFVITQDGDRLDHLAQQFYGNVNLWWYIAKANNLTFMTIPAGTSLRIPATTKYAIGV
tara:strand:+ start:625 stop:930 length:306 start_codon:yes stop_codon:yes gene_type:complete